MKKLNETEDVANLKQARAQAINWAEKSYPNISKNTESKERVIEQQRTAQEANNPVFQVISSAGLKDQVNSLKDCAFRVIDDNESTKPYSQFGKNLIVSQCNLEISEAKSVCNRDNHGESDCSGIIDRVIDQIYSERSSFRF